MQPLDVTFMGPLKTYYSENIRLHIQEFRRPVETADVVKLFGAAYKSAATYRVSENGFKASGIVPYNPNIFTEVDYLEEKLRKKELKLEAKAKRLAAAAAAAADAVEAANLEFRAQKVAGDAAAIITNACNTFSALLPQAEPSVETPAQSCVAPPAQPSLATPSTRSEDAADGMPHFFFCRNNHQNDFIFQSNFSIYFRDFQKNCHTRRDQTSSKIDRKSTRKKGKASYAI